MIRFFNPALTYKSMKEELDEAYFRVMNGGDLILRQDVEEFEKTLAEFVGTKYAVALNSGTDALYLALRALNIGRGDDVLVPSRTFVATAQVVKQVGAEPVFYDTDGVIQESMHGYNLKAIIPVHIEGALDTNYEKMLALAKELDIPIIEDACQALGAVKNPQTLVQCWSFYPAKILGAFGDAGGITTNDEAMYRYIKDGRNHFKDDARDWGINSRLDNLQAAFLNVRFKRIDWMLAKRKEVAEKYDVGIKGVKLPPHTEGRVWQDYLIRCKSKDEREELFAYLKEKGVETMRNNYPFPVPKLPLAQAYEDETLRLPCNENLTDDEVDEVIKNVNEFFNL